MSVLQCRCRAHRSHPSEVRSRRRRSTWRRGRADCPRPEFDKSSAITTAGRTEAALRKGWYHSGATLKSDANGFLTITGRIKADHPWRPEYCALAEVEKWRLLHPQVVERSRRRAPRHARRGSSPVCGRERGELDVHSLLVTVGPDC